VEIRKAYRILVGKPLRKCSLRRRLRRSWKELTLRQSLGRTVVRVRGGLNWIKIMPKIRL
jgi:hypothetical protein